MKEKRTHRYHMHATYRAILLSLLMISFFALALILRMHFHFGFETALLCAFLPLIILVFLFRKNIETIVSMIPPYLHQILSIEKVTAAEYSRRHHAHLQSMKGFLTYTLIWGPLVAVGGSLALDLLMTDYSVRDTAGDIGLYRDTIISFIPLSQLIGLSLFSGLSLWLFAFYNSRDKS